MPTIVDVPGMGEVEFPDGMSDDQIATAIKSNMQQSAPQAPQKPAPSFQRLGDYRDKYAGQSLAQGNLNYMKDYGRGIADAVTKPRQPDIAPPMVGVGETALHLGSSALAPLFALPDWAITKMGFPDERNPSGTYAGARDKYVYEPRTPTGQAGADIAGAALKPVSDVFGLMGSGYSDIAGLAGASPGVQKEVRDIAPDVVGLGLAAASMRAPKAKAVVPTTEQLGTQAKAAYKRAEDAGIAVNGPSFDAMKMKLLDDMEKSGIDKDLHPDASAALRRVASESGPVTLEKLETLRRIASDAEASIKPADSRIAGQITDAIDDFVENLKDSDVAAGDPKQAAALKEARNLYSRKKKSQEIERLMERAELSAPNFSASGMENAIRTEFRTLAKNERRMRRFSKEEQAAIKKVATGDLPTNALRMLGKFAPTGAVSTAIGGGLGFMAGGPAGAVGLPAAGGLARLAASQFTKKNAAAAQELMRRGPQTPQATSVVRPPSAPAAGLLAQPANSEAARRELIARLLAQSSSR